MTASQRYLTPQTPLGATPVADGALFRCWAPNATAVYLVFPPTPPDEPWTKLASQLLVPDEQGVWSGFFPGVQAGDVYRFYVVGSGSAGFKRDPRARELAFDDYPNCGCVGRSD